jgi:asparagine synthase (glutamine-hydrolysing)
LCGIAGTFLEADERAVRAMIAAIAHRGPDDRGFLADRAAAFGHARLAILDLSPSGHQPMADQTGNLWIVFNGEIYNWRSERALLEQQGWRFRSQSDTEVLLALYHRYGDRFVTRLRGMFAFAIYDRRRGPGREKLLLARDQFGIKPLFYASLASGVMFASELKAMLASGRASGAIDPAGLRTLLTFGSVFQPRTLLADVAMLPSAHILTATRGGTRIERYWSHRSGAEPELRRLSHRELVRRTRAVLEDSVSLQQVADVPVGAFLSGGVDSSLIAALMAQRVPGRLKTFSVGFESAAASLDESHEAAEIAARLGTDHTRVVVTGRDVRNEIERFAVGLDQPSVDGFNSYFVSQAAARDVKVALSGTGGDELFAGYPWFAGMVPSGPDAANALLKRVSRKLRGAALTLSGTRADDSARRDAFLDRYGRFYHCFGPAGLGALLAGDYRESAGSFVGMPTDLAPLDELPDAPVLDRVSALCLNGYTRNQLLRDIDACSMIHSLEVRVPFLDPMISDFALSLPQSAKLSPDGRPLAPEASYDRSGIKRVIVDVARGYLPAEFFSRRTKRGFGMPFASWLTGPLREVVDDTLSPDTVRRRGIFDPASVQTLHRDFMDGKQPWNGPWLLMITELWCRTVRNTSPGMADAASSPATAQTAARWH